MHFPSVSFRATKKTTGSAWVPTSSASAALSSPTLTWSSAYAAASRSPPPTSLRTDRYGGTVANRIRFAVEAVAATVETVGAVRTGIRLWPGGGFWGVEESDVVNLCTALLIEPAG